jgi:hypothetical protein
VPAVCGFCDARRQKSLVTVTSASLSIQVRAFGRQHDDVGPSITTLAIAVGPPPVILFEQLQAQPDERLGGKDALAGVPHRAQAA